MSAKRREANPLRTGVGEGVGLKRFCPLCFFLCRGVSEAILPQISSGCAAASVRSGFLSGLEATGRGGASRRPGFVRLRETFPESAVSAARFGVHVECGAAYPGGQSGLDPISSEPRLRVGAEEVGEG